MNNTSFAAPELHDDFVGLDFPSYGTVTIQDAEIGASVPGEKTGSPNVTILALDLGTKCGYALRNRDGKIIHGTEAFTPRETWSPGQRWQRFRSWINGLITTHQVHAIAYEEVRRHLGTESAHVYGAFLALVQLSADSHRLSLHPVGVGTIKKHFTGNGAAKKGEMIKEAKRRGFRPEDDNNADALAILSWAIKQEVAR